MSHFGAVEVEKSRQIEEYQRRSDAIQHGESQHREDWKRSSPLRTVCPCLLLWPSMAVEYWYEYCTWSVSFIICLACEECVVQMLWTCDYWTDLNVELVIVAHILW